MADVVHRETCRLCGSREVELVVPMPSTAIADAYVAAAGKDTPQPVYSLDLYFCGVCAHVQLLDVVDPRLMFKPDYTFRTGSSSAIVQNLGVYAAGVLDRENPPVGSLVVDIGSNDGTFLGFFQKAGLNVLGIDPATELAKDAVKAGIETLPHFLDPALAERVRKERGPARLVTANNVFAHADDMAGMAESVRRLLSPDGLFVFEISYVVDVVEKMLLGTIFHEHLCYHSIQPLTAFLTRHGLELVDVERVPAQGGSIHGFAQPKGGPRAVSPRVAELAAYERGQAFDRPETYRDFGRRLDSVRDRLAEIFDGAAGRGEAVVGFGAARGGTTLLYRLDVGRRLAFIVDDSPSKQGLFSPGHHIPILPTQALYDRRPSYVFILASVHAQAIMKANSRYLDQGGKFVVSDPCVEVVSAAAERER